VEGRRLAVLALLDLAPGCRERRRVAAAGFPRAGTVVELEVDEVGPSLRWATAKVTKATRGGGAGGGGGGSSYGGGGASAPASDDPWSTPAASGGGTSDEPPF